MHAPGLTVEQGIVEDVEAADDEDQAGDAANGALGGTAAAATADHGPAPFELGLQTLPGFLGVGHVWRGVKTEGGGW